MSDVQAAVREKPILFSSEMVRAILDGRKSMTRRIVKPQPEYFEQYPHWRWKPKRGPGAVFGPFAIGSGDRPGMFAPWQVGDRLWVREAWQQSRLVRKGGGERKVVRHPERGLGDVHYAASPETFTDGEPPRWRPSIHLPRWASRITLEITEVRVERVQDISARDIIAEGVQYPVSADRRPMVRLTGKCPPVKYHRRINITKGETLTHEELLRCHFASLWDEINGEGSWESNPWVWVISFNRLEAQ